MHFREIQLLIASSLHLSKQDLEIQETKVAESTYEKWRRDNRRVMSNRWDFSERMPRSKETEARMKILVLVTTAISIIVVFLFTITYPYINNDIGYDDGPTSEPASSFCPLLIPPEYGRLDCNSVRSINSVKVECQVWCSYGTSNSTLNSTADGIAGVALQITCLDSEIWGVSQESLSSLCAAPAPKNVTDT